MSRYLADLGHRRCTSDCIDQAPSQDLVPYRCLHDLISFHMFVQWTAPNPVRSAATQVTLSLPNDES